MAQPFFNCPSLNGSKNSQKTAKDRTFKHYPRPIFNAARRVSPLLVMSNTHFDMARRVNTLVVTSKPNPPYPGHGYGFWTGDPNSTRTCTHPTRICLPARVCKPVTNPRGVMVPPEPSAPDVYVILLDNDKQHLQCQVVDRCRRLFD